MLQFPPSMHMCVTMVHTADGFLERFLGDLAQATAELVANPPTKAFLAIASCAIYSF